jgi:zinc transporter 1
MAWSKEKRIVTMLILDTIFFLVELGGGIYARSLALQADAFHMVRVVPPLPSPHPRTAVGRPANPDGDAAQ